MRPKNIFYVSIGVLLSLSFITLLLAIFHPETGIFGRAKFPKKFLTVKFKKNIHGYQKRT